MNKASWRGVLFGAMAKRLLLILLLLGSIGTLACQGQARERPQASVGTMEAAKTDSSFASLIERLSEPGGYFDTDNLISNERSYLHVMGKMREVGVNGGIYIGVGPDQNFSYIAQVRPTIAFIIDIRRDNLLEHLMFKAAFALSDNRIEYLCLLFACPVPDDTAGWGRKEIQELVNYVDGSTTDGGVVSSARTAILDQAQRFGLELADADLTTIGRIHQEFLDGGLDLQFTSFYRRPQRLYPTYRDLLLERDLTGRQTNYMTTEDDFQFIKRLQERNLIVPVVGDLAGDHALAAIARYVEDRGERISAFYVSNIEFYLVRQEAFDRFAETVARLPIDNRSVIIRSLFGRGAYQHPQAVPGYGSTQLLQTIGSFVDEYGQGGYRSYWDIVSKHVLNQ